MTTRLIEKWLPIAELGEESVRERRSMTALPPTYYLHVWWARRPLVASRAAVLASLLPEDADRDKFMHMLGIHGDPVKARQAIDNAVRTGVRVKDPYGYDRAFGYAPSDEEKSWLREKSLRTETEKVVVLDPTAGGGSIPFESLRLGVNTFSNELNPVAAIILRATIEFPREYGGAVLEEYDRLSSKFLSRVNEQIEPLFPKGPDEVTDTTYLWARTVSCPYCDMLIPLSPSWKLAPNGTGVALHPDTEVGRCSFEIVHDASAHSQGTVSVGEARCPSPDCGRVVDAAEIKRQCTASMMDEQSYTVVCREKSGVQNSGGKESKTKGRVYRSHFTR